MTILRPYIYRHTPYRPPPLYQGLGSRVLQGHRDPGSRVTMGHRVTMVTGLIRSQGHWVIGSITRVFSMVRVSMVTMVLGHGSLWVTITRITGSQGHRVTGSPGSQGYPHPSHRVTRITGSQGHPGLGSRVTGSPWYWVTGSPLTRVTGLPITRDLESPITRVTGLPWSQGYYHH